MKGNFHVRFLGGCGRATARAYPANFAFSRISRLVLSVGSALALCSASQAQIQTLVDANSFSDINPNNQQGMFDWFVDGQNQLFQQWFWYRVGLNPEQSIDTISAPLISRPDAKTADITYNNGAFSVAIDYSLTGGSAGSGKATMLESIKIHNFTGSPLDFHFFQYSDFNLLNNPNGDTVALGTDLSGKFNEALQTKGPLISPILTETDITPGANHGETAFVGQTLAKLNNALPDNLNDNAGPTGPGNVTWAFQWDYSGPDSIAPGGDELISKTLLIQVPEPSALALISIGAAALALHQRRRSRDSNPTKA
jgi:hypothetical protein